MATRAENIYEILRSLPSMRLSITDIRRKLVAEYGDSPQKLEGPTIYATVRNFNRTRQSNGQGKIFNYSGDGSENSGYVSIAGSISAHKQASNIDSDAPLVEAEQSISVIPSPIVFPDTHRIATLTIDDRLLDLVYKSIDIAVKYQEASCGIRKMPITGEVGEVLICKQLNLNLVADLQSAGFDAIDNDGLKVQIKTRREGQDEPKGNHVRVGRFSEHYFDYALLGIIDRQYRLREVWRSEYADLKPVIDKEKRRNPSMSSFKRVAKRIL